MSERQWRGDPVGNLVLAAIMACALLYPLFHIGTVVGAGQARASMQTTIDRASAEIAASTPRYRCRQFKFFAGIMRCACYELQDDGE